MLTNKIIREVRDRRGFARGVITSGGTAVRIGLCLFGTSVGLSSGVATEIAVDVRVDQLAGRGEGRAAESDESEVLSGHSYHGDFLNEGPRQFAVPIDGTGAVDFPVTTTEAEAQRFVSQGLGQYYGFWYLEAERSFRHAANLDPECAMAYWGAALSTAKSPDRARGFIRAAMKRKDQVTARERMYIEALADLIEEESAEEEGEGQNDEKPNESTKREKAKKKQAAEKERRERLRRYTSDLEAIALEYPDDVEAKALLALRLYENRRVLPNPSFLAVDGLLEAVFASVPMHPAHHFRIHLWDYKKPEKALRSAGLCGPAAPGIAHMWHMPGHIYSRLHRYHDACWQQEASARVDHAHMMDRGLLPDQIHNFAHNNEWLIRNLNFVGRAEEAVELGRNMISLPRHPKFNTPDKIASASYGRERLIGTLFRYERWREAIGFCEAGVIESPETPKAFKTPEPPGAVKKEKTNDDKSAKKRLGRRVDRLRLLAVASYHIGDVGRGDRAAGQLHEILQSQFRLRSLAAAEDVPTPGPADTKPADASSTNVLHPTSPGFAARLRRRAKFTGAIETVREAIAHADSARLRYRGQHKASLESLKNAGDRISTTELALAHMRAEEFDRALELGRAEVAERENEVLPLAGLVEILWRRGDTTELSRRFGELQRIASDLDRESVVYRRIASIAAGIDSKYRRNDWRLPREVPDDVGRRPDLSTLGPFRWHPTPAPDWTLESTGDRSLASKDFLGRPVVVIFYLGHGCLHCAEQLHAFAPKAAAFRASGIELVAISSDPITGLRQSLADFGPAEMPIPLLADPAHRVFKSYGVYDDFEDQPLHGTFLVDGEGRIRWRDVGFEPFMDADFVLNESTRLLRQRIDKPSGSGIDAGPDRGKRSP